MAADAAEVTYPVGEESYELIEEIGSGVSAVVWRARCIPLDVDVAIKVINLESDSFKIDEFRKEIQVMSLAQHENVVSYHCSFIVDDHLWLVMNLLSQGSCLDILQHHYPDGFQDETLIATIMAQVIRAVAYFHDNDQIHRDIKAGNILLNSEGVVQVADFGVTRTLGSKEKARTFVGTPCWMAPEVLEQGEGYGLPADIWSLGITAMELAHGHPPYHDLLPMKVMLCILNQDTPSLADMEAAKDDPNPKRKFSSHFDKFVKACLQKDPAARPTAQRLLEMKFIKNAKKPDYIVMRLLNSLPGETLAERYARQLARRRLDEPAVAETPKPMWDFSPGPSGADATNGTETFEFPPTPAAVAEDNGDNSITSDSESSLVEASGESELDEPDDDIVLEESSES